MREGGGGRGEKRRGDKSRAGAKRGEARRGEESVERLFFLLVLLPGKPSGKGTGGNAMPLPPEKWLPPHHGASECQQTET